MSVEDVYADVTRRHIQQYRALNILCACDLGSKKLPGPTWAPDWSNQRLSEDISESNSAETAEADVEFVDGGILRVAGVACGVVVNINTLSLKHNLHDIEERITKVAPPGVLTSSYITGCTQLEAFCGTMIGSSFPQHDPSHSTMSLLEPAMKNLRSFLQLGVAGSMRDNRQFGHYLADVYLAARGRCLISTDGGYLGLGPEAVEEGDMVAVLLGCKTPILLRPAGAQFKVVGEGFVYGLSNGEASLGPLPENTEMLLRYNGDPTLSGNYWAYRNTNTGDDSWDDPRLSRFGMATADLGGRKGQDRRVTVDTLKSAGISIQYFDLT